MTISRTKIVRRDSLSFSASIFFVFLVLDAYHKGGTADCLPAAHVSLAAF